MPRLPEVQLVSRENLSGRRWNAFPRRSDRFRSDNRKHGEVRRDTAFAGFLRAGRHDLLLVQRRRTEARVPRSGDCKRRNAFAPGRSGKLHAVLQDFEAKDDARTRASEISAHVIRAVRLRRTRGFLPAALNALFTPPGKLKKF